MKKKKKRPPATRVEKKPKTRGARTTSRRKAAGTVEQLWTFRLFVTGGTANSARALSNLREFCDKHLAGRYELEVVDVYRNPELAREDQIVAAPTLVRKSPLPQRKLVGDLSDTTRVRSRLDLDGDGK